LGLDLLAAPVRQPTGLLTGPLGELLPLPLRLLGCWLVAPTTAPGPPGCAAEVLVHGFLSSLIYHLPNTRASPGYTEVRLQTAKVSKVQQNPLKFMTKRPKTHDDGCKTATMRI
jgi:hypothetical protein